MRFELQRILDKERHACVLITHDVEEAIHLADRILVLSRRPATIQATFAVGLARPRDLASPEVARLKAAILRELGL
jgi:ABC-type nitrate/sulfonate/bicarbonate transport system ATPase subunit